MATKCPFCQSEEILPSGYDEESAELWKCMNCGQIFMRADLLLDDDNVDDETPLYGEQLPIIAPRPVDDGDG